MPVELKELEDLIKADGKLTHELQQKFEKLGEDYISKDEYKKLETAVADGAKARAAAEAEFKAGIAAANKLAEEASLKAGRRGSADVNEPNAEDVAHKEAFITYLRKRDDHNAVQNLRDAEAKAVTVAVPGSGGFAVPTLISAMIDSKVPDESVMENLVDTVEVGSANYSILVDKGGMGFGWVGESDARAGTATPGIYPVDPVGGTLYAYPEASEESMGDIFFNVETWLLNSALTAFANGKDFAIIAGDGLKKPLGMLGTAPLVTADGARTDGIYQYLPTGAAGDFGADAHKNIIDLIYAPKAMYRANASFLMNSLTTAKVRVLKDGNGRPLWTDNQQAGQPPLLEGYAVNAVESMPDFAANAHPIAFGDYKRGYTLVNRHGLRVTKDEITKPGFVKWHIRKRLDGAPTNDDAIKFLKVAGA